MSFCSIRYDSAKALSALGVRGDGEHPYDSGVSPSFIYLLHLHGDLRL